MLESSVATTIHGRYLTIPPGTSGPAPLLIGFHGYGEDAETQLERLRAIPASDQWLKISIQALHRFYHRRTDRVVASWMTRQDRELAITDNIAYVRRSLEAVTTEWPTKPIMVFAGFSQGVGMAFRAAVHATQHAAGVIAAGGDIPPEIPPSGLSRISATLIARGATDELYAEEQFAKDEHRLRQSSTDVRTLRTNNGHDWSDELNAAASEFLRERIP